MPPGHLTWRPPRPSSTCRRPIALTAGRGRTAAPAPPARVLIARLRVPAPVPQPDPRARWCAPVELRHGVAEQHVSPGPAPNRNIRQPAGQNSRRRAVRHRRYGSSAAACSGRGCAAGAGRRCSSKAINRDERASAHSAPGASSRSPCRPGARETSPRLGRGAMAEIEVPFPSRAEGIPTPRGAIDQRRSTVRHHDVRPRLRPVPAAGLAFSAAVRGQNSTTAASTTPVGGGGSDGGTSKTGASTAWCQGAALTNANVRRGRHSARDLGTTVNRRSSHAVHHRWRCRAAKPAWQHHAARLPAASGTTARARTPVSNWGGAAQRPGSGHLGTPGRRRDDRQHGDDGSAFRRRRSQRWCSRRSWPPSGRHTTAVATFAPARALDQRQLAYDGADQPGSHAASSGASRTLTATVARTPGSTTASSTTALSSEAATTSLLPATLLPARAASCDALRNGSYQPHRQASASTNLATWSPPPATPRWM